LILILNICLHLLPPNDGSKCIILGIALKCEIAEKLKFSRNLPSWIIRRETSFKVTQACVPFSLSGENPLVRLSTLAGYPAAGKGESTS